jgi:hypothetical protein
MLLLVKKYVSTVTIESSEKFRSRVEKFILKDIDINNHRIPVGLCATCRVLLGKINAGEQTIDALDLTQLACYMEAQRIQNCNCLVCQVAKANGGEAMKLLTKFKKPIGECHGQANHVNLTKNTKYPLRAANPWVANRPAGGWSPSGHIIMIP